MAKTAPRTKKAAPKAEAAKPKKPVKTGGVKGAAKAAAKAPAAETAKGKAATAAAKPAARKAKAPARTLKAKAAKVSPGDQLHCVVCGLVVSVDESCGCVEACDIVCCNEQMRKK